MGRGCVRDQLLGQTPKDYDVATSATPEQIREVFGRRRTIPIGAAFGVITVLGRREEGQIEVATFREDAAYSDGRHPDAVTFSTAEADAARRDFTINGLFFDPIGRKVIDYVDGQQDLARGVVRAIGDPRQRIAEDKLRMLRAVRFAATLGFELEAGTLAAIRSLAEQVTLVSAERIGVEVRQILRHRSRAEGMRLLAASSLFAHVLPEIAELPQHQPPEAWDEMLGVLDRLTNPTVALALAVALMFADDAPAAARMAGHRLRSTNHEIERAVWLVGQIGLIATAPEMPWPQLQRLLIHEGADELIAMREAIAGTDDPAAVICREKLGLPEEELNPSPLISGHDLITRGLTPGQQFATILAAVRDAQLEGRIHTPEEALRLVDQIAKDGG